MLLINKTNNPVCDNILGNCKGHRELSADFTCSSLQHLCVFCCLYINTCHFDTDCWVSVCGGGAEYAAAHTHTQKCIVHTLIQWSFHLKIFFVSIPKLYSFNSCHWRTLKWLTNKAIHSGASNFHYSNRWRQNTLLTLVVNFQCDVNVRAQTLFTNTHLQYCRNTQ